MKQISVRSNFTPPQLNVKGEDYNSTRGEEEAIKIIQQNGINGQIPITLKTQTVTPLCLDGLQQKMKLPPARSDFVGREEILSRIKIHFSPFYWHETDSTIVKILYGSAGIGKTEIAIAFGHKNVEHFSLIWFIPCGTRELYEQSYRELAEVFNIPYQEDSIPILIRKVHSKLEEGLDGKPWLLIFDHVEQMLSKDQIPRVGGCVLMTTRNDFVKEKKCIDIPPFSAEECEELFRKIGDTKEIDQMPNLMDVLLGYPILINLAARSMGAVQNLEEYINVLESPEALCWEIKQASRYPKAMGPVFHMLHEQIKKKNLLAFEFLELSAFLNPDYIPINFLEFWLNEKNASEEKVNILKMLSDYGLIRCNEVKETLSLHRLQQQVIKTTVKEGKYKEFISLLARWSKGFSLELPDTWKIGAGCFLQVGTRSDDPFWKKNDDFSSQEQILSVCENWARTVKGNITLARQIQEINKSPESSRNKPDQLNTNESGWGLGLNLIFGGGVVLATLAAGFFYAKLKEI